MLFYSWGQCDEWFKTDICRRLTWDRQDNKCTIFTGAALKDPKGKYRKLIPKSELEYFVEGLPVILRFEGSDCFTVEGGLVKWKD